MLGQTTGGGLGTGLGGGGLKLGTGLGQQGQLTFLAFTCTHTIITRHSDSICITSTLISVYTQKYGEPDDPVPIII